MACWKTVAGKTAVPQHSVEFKTSRVAAVYFWGGFVSITEECDLAGRVVNGCSSAVSSPSRLPGMDAFGVISSVAAHASLGCKDNTAQPQLKAPMSS